MELHCVHTIYVMYIVCLLYGYSLKTYGCCHFSKTQDMISFRHCICIEIYTCTNYTKRFVCCIFRSVKCHYFDIRLFIKYSLQCIFAFEQTMKTDGFRRKCNDVSDFKRLTWTEWSLPCRNRIKNPEFVKFNGNLWE